MMEERYPSNYIILFIGGILALIIVRLLISMRFLGVVVLSILLLVGIIYSIIIQLKKNQEQKRYANSTEGQIVERLEMCQNELNKHQDAIKSIKKSMSEIGDKLNGAEQINPKIKEDSSRLIQKFEAELRLRESKIQFFKTCIYKLEGLLRNHQIAKDLLQKEEKLKKLQEDHYEDLGKMEEIKSNLEYDTFYLEAIDDLSNKMELSLDFTNAESINEELLKMTKDIEGL